MTLPAFEKPIPLGMVSAILEIPIFKLRRAAKRGEFPTYRLGNGRILVRLSEVNAGLERSRSWGWASDGEARLPSFDPDARSLPLELAACSLGVSIELVQTAANRALFATSVDQSGVRVGKLSQIAIALVRMSDLQPKPPVGGSTDGVGGAQ